MLTGKKPYVSTSIIDIVIQHKQAPVPQLPEDLAEYQPLLNNMMAKDRNKRIPDAETLVQTIEKLQRKHKRLLADLDFDITGALSQIDPVKREKRGKQILFGMLLGGMVLFSTLEYVDIRLKAPTSTGANASTNTVLNEVEGNVSIVEQVQTRAESVPAPVVQQAAPAEGPDLDEVLNALIWLGDESLAEFKLTYPPKDNAYYYFSRLLELDPGNQVAINGIYRIADQYAVLAEQAMRENDLEKTTSYVDIGLKINPNNQALLSMRQFMQNYKTGFLNTIKSFFSG